MRLTSLHLRTPELRLDDLSPGFNVIHAPHGQTRMLLPEAVRGVLFGALPHWHSERDEPQPRTVCELGVLSAWGRFDLQRIVALQGERFVARDSNGENRGTWLRQRLLTDLTEAAFSSLFTPRLGDHADFDALVRQAHGESGAAHRRASLENLLRELEATRPWDRQDERMAKVREHEARLMAEIEQLEQSADSPREVPETIHARLDAALTRWERRWRIAGRKLQDIQQRLKMAQAAAANQRDDMALRERLARTGSQIDRLEQVMQDLRQRSLELGQKLDNERPDQHAPLRAKLTSRYQSLLLTLTEMAQQLETEFAALHASPLDDTPWTATATRLLPRLEQLNAKLQLLCERLRQPHNAGRRSYYEKKYAKLTACYDNLQVQLDNLIKRRAAIRARLARQRKPSAAQAAELETLHLVHAAAERRHRYCQQRVLKLRRRIAAAARRVRPHVPSVEPRLSEARRELVEVRAQLAELGLRQHGESQSVLERLRELLTQRRFPAIFDEASRTLRQLTDGELVALRPRTWGNDVVIEHAHGKAVTYDVLSRAERDQVHLSLALAAAADAAQRGMAFPLILDDALRHVEPGRLRTAIELLRDYCRLHGQVILMTSQQNVATLCRSIGVASFVLDEPRGVVDDTLETPRMPTRRSPVARRSTVREIAWDCEEFPGELRDRTLTDQHASSVAAVHDSPTGAAHLPAHQHEDIEDEVDVRSANGRILIDGEACPAEKLRVSGFYLQLCDRVSEMPCIPLKISQDIEASGVYTVANFLHADPVRLAERLSDFGASITDVRGWQGQARLMCGVRKLRAYDAKILVACGVTSPEQLADIRPHELSEMVEAFVATPEGSRLVRSGSDFEISRITRWIRSVGQVSHASTAAAAVPRPVAQPQSRPQKKSPIRPQLKPLPKPEPAARRSAAPATSRRPRPSGESKRKSAPIATPSTARSTQRSAGDAVPARNGKARTAAKAASQNGKAARVLPLKFHLEPSSHVEAAPSIGPQMARRLETIGIITVANLLAIDPTVAAQRLANRRVTADTVRQWQQQAELVCRIPQLRGHDAQLLVACGLTTPEQLARADAAALYRRVLPLAESKAGQRILRSGALPTAAEVENWIQWARQARKLTAA